MAEQRFEEASFVQLPADYVVVPLKYLHELQRVYYQVKLEKWKPTHVEPNKNETARGESRVPNPERTPPTEHVTGVKLKGGPMGPPGMTRVVPRETD